MIVYYNPDCSKCREVEGLLQERQCEFKIRDYLKDPLSRAELIELKRLLKCSFEDLVRKSDVLYLQNYGSMHLDEEGYLDLLLRHPVLMLRPIIIDGSRAVIGRPPVKVLELL